MKTNDIRMSRPIADTGRIMAKGVEISNNTRKTGVNNNDLIIGPAGAGKTRGYIIPYILHSEESMIIADTKGNLHTAYGKYLKEKGYNVKCINFKDVELTACGYNPLDYVRVKDGKANDQDVMRVVAAMCPMMDTREPFWDQSAHMLLSAYVHYIMETCSPSERNLANVFKLYRKSLIQDGRGHIKISGGLREFCNNYPDSNFSRKMCQFDALAGSEKTMGCIMMFISTALAALDNETICNMLTMKNRVNFNDFFKKKTALFLNISDNDRTLDNLVNLLYTQALQTFINEADKLPDCRMPIPVRFLLDDFATNTRINDFDNIISVIRSREISVSLIIQSFSQLDKLYGPDAAKTIKDNCEHWLFLGSLNMATAEEIAKRVDVRVNTILDMPLTTAYIISRGGKPMKVDKYDLEEDPIYKRLKSQNSIKQETRKSIQAPAV